MANVRAILNEVWSELRQVNVVDDLAIIEYIAALLVEDKIDVEGSKWPFDEELRPQKPRVRYNPDDERIKNQLRNAARELSDQSNKGTTQRFYQNTSEGVAELFDRHVLFFPPKYPGKGLYPTPRHIIDFMLNILQIRPEYSFADLACGSGGFLIRRTQQQTHKITQRHTGETFGIDITADWIRIALANIFLHNQQNNIRLQIGNIFRIFSETKKLESRVFDRIALSPPLGSVVNISEELPLFSEEASAQASESAFTSLVVDRLKATGKGAIIVSSDFITFDTQGTHLNNGAYKLKEQLVNQRLLRAIVTQKNGLFNSLMPVHILYIDKDPRRQMDFIWLCQAERDGYPLKQRRNFAQNPKLEPQDNDLPFLQKIVQMTGRRSEFDASENIGPFWHKKFFLRNRCIGIALKPHTGAKLRQIRYGHFGKIPYISVEVSQTSHSSETTTSHDMLLYRSPSNGDTLPLPFVYGGRDERTIFANGDEGQLIAISEDGRLLGITKTLAEIGDRYYNLFPLDYFTKHYELPVHSLPHSVIAENRTLVGTSETKELYIEEEVLPPQISRHTTALLRLLNARQYAIWEFIDRYYSTARYALHFTPEQIQRSFKEGDVTSTLELLEHIGLIRRVVLTGTKDQPPQLLYRRMIETEVLSKPTRNAE